MSLLSLPAPSAAADAAKPLAFGLVAYLVYGEREQPPPRPIDDDKPICRCNAVMTKNDTLTRKYAGEEETFFWCHRCHSYCSPVSGKRYASVVL